MEPDMKKFLKIFSRNAGEDLEIFHIEFAQNNGLINSRHSKTVVRDIYNFMDEINNLLSNDNKLLSFQFDYTNDRSMKVDLLLSLITMVNSVELLPLKELAAADLIGKGKYLTGVQIAFTED